MTTLTAIYTRLLAYFGPLTGPTAQRPWWPIYGSDPPFEQLVGAVLVQQTRWETVEAALFRLIGLDWLRPLAMAAADPAALAELIRPAAFHRQKAPGLIAIARHITVNYAGSTAALLAQPTPTVRAELLSLPRIGYETGDVVMLYAGGHAIFVVDEYTRRLFERVFYQPGANEPATRSQWRQPYEILRQAIEAELAPSLPAADQAPLYAEFHAQINEVCVRYCLARPRCDGPPARRVYSRQPGRPSYLDRDEGCPLRAICGWYVSRDEG